VDVGIDNPQPTTATPEVQLSPPAEFVNTDANLRRHTLEKAEKMFANALAVDAGTAISDSASEEIRVFRDDSFPAMGKEAATIMLNSDHGKMTRKVSGGAMSTSDDLAFRYGSCSSERGKSTEPGYFLTIWKVDRNGNWKIILDLQKKAETK
jgi:hypothetical protein